MKKGWNSSFLKKLPKIPKFCPVVWLLDADDFPVDEKRMRQFFYKKFAKWVPTTCSEN
jgi:hypothetical protein